MWQKNPPAWQQHQNDWKQRKCGLYKAAIQDATVFFSDFAPTADVSAALIKSTAAASTEELKQSTAEELIFTVDLAPRDATEYTADAAEQDLKCIASDNLQHGAYEQVAAAVEVERISQSSEEVAVVEVERITQSAEEAISDTSSESHATVSVAVEAERISQSAKEVAAAISQSVEEVAAAADVEQISKFAAEDAISKIAAAVEVGRTSQSTEEVRSVASETEDLDQAPEPVSQDGAFLQDAYVATSALPSSLSAVASAEACDADADVERELEGLRKVLRHLTSHLETLCEEADQAAAGLDTSDFIQTGCESSSRDSTTLLMQQDGEAPAAGEASMQAPTSSSRASVAYVAHRYVGGLTRQLASRRPTVLEFKACDVLAGSVCDDVTLSDTTSGTSSSSRELMEQSSETQEVHSELLALEALLDDVVGATAMILDQRDHLRRLASQTSLKIESHS